MGHPDTLSGTEGPQLGLLEHRLLDEFQRDLPIVRQPFAYMANRLGSDEAGVLALLERRQRDGTISRVGPVFRPHAVGTSTLAAMAVPEAQLESVAALVNAYPEVNHNYEREHDFNLWFVVTAPDEAHLQRVLAEMEQRTGLAVLSLPMLEAYHIDLGFRLQWGERTRQPEQQGMTRVTARHRSPAGGRAAIEGEADRRLIAAVQNGLPLVSHPFAAIAADTGLSEKTVMLRLMDWVEEGVISRFGVVVRHRRLGFRANAMVVWDVPDEEVTSLGHCLGGYDFVTLCYQRPRRPPVWPYNLFCMIHGQDRDTVRERVEWVVEQCGLEHIPHRLLFSRRSFKQRGARYQGVETAGESRRNPIQLGEGADQHA